MTTQHIHPAIGDPVEFLKRQRSFDKSCDFYNAHYDELLEQFPDEWIGIYEGVVRAHSGDLHDLFAQIDAQRVPRDCSFFVCLETNPLPKIL